MKENKPKLSVHGSIYFFYGTLHLCLKTKKESHRWFVFKSPFSYISEKFYHSIENPFIVEIAGEFGEKELWLTYNGEENE